MKNGQTAQLAELLITYANKYTCKQRPIKASKTIDLLCIYVVLYNWYYLVDCRKPNLVLLFSRCHFGGQSLDWQIQPSAFKWSHQQHCLCEKTAKVTRPYTSTNNLASNSVKKKKNLCLFLLYLFCFCFYSVGWRDGNKEPSVMREEHWRKRNKKTAVVCFFFCFFYFWSSK